MKVLAKLAGKARRLLVEFNWPLGRADLLELRRGIFNASRTLGGRYKCFDSRLLAAVNTALEDPRSGYALVEPRDSVKPAYSVSCVPDGDQFRLTGYAPFDIVLGYPTFLRVDRWARVHQQGARRMGVPASGPARLH